MCAPLAIAVGYRLALAGALHMGRGGAPPLLIPPTSHACRQTAADTTVATVMRIIDNIFYVVRSSLYHLALATPFEKNGYLLLRCGGWNCKKPKIRRNSVNFRFMVLG